MANVETVLRDHVTLNIDCIDRLYLNGYVPRLQRPENVWWFLHEHRGHPIVSPTLLGKMSETFVAAIKAFAERHQVPVIQFKDDDRRKEEIAREYLTRFEGTEGVVLIGVAQEMVSGFRVKTPSAARPKFGRSYCGASGARPH
jgi:hypothetical protein